MSADAVVQARSVASALETTSRMLQPRAPEDAARDASLLLAGVLGLKLSELWSKRDRELTADERAELAARVRRRRAGEPLQYIEGRASFRTLELTVNRNVLIPRPETEQLVECVLEWSAGRSDLRFLEIGTGSGAIALSLLSDGPFAAGVAVDISRDALKVAEHNAKEAGFGTSIDFRVGACFEAVRLAERFDVVVSNPPYVTEREWDALPAEVREWEPREALDGGHAGLDLIGPIVSGAPAHLTERGLLALEVSSAVAGSTVGYLREAGCWREPRVERDLAGRIRFVTCELLLPSNGTT